MPGSVIVSTARTPIGKLSGALAALSATDLGGLAIKAALERAGVDAEQVDYVYHGPGHPGRHRPDAGTPGGGQGGIPLSVPVDRPQQGRASRASTRSTLADLLIRAGDAEVVVAGGMESMTQAPHLLQKSREGYQYGDVELLDSMASRRLMCGLDRSPWARPPSGTTRATRSRASAQDELPPGATSGRPTRPRTALRRGDRAHRDPAAQGRPDRVHRRRGRPRRHHRRVARQAAPGLHEGRHHHRGHRLADLRRGRGSRGDEPGEGRGARPGAGSPRSARTASSRVPTPRCTSSRPTRSARRWAARGSTPADSTCSSSTRRSPRWAWRRCRPRRERRHGQRQRRRHRAGSPGRHVGARVVLTISTSCAVVAAASAPPRCAAAAARATPPSCARCSNPPRSGIAKGPPFGGPS